MAESSTLDAETRNGGGSKKSLIILICALIILLIIAVAGALYLTGVIGPQAVTGEVSADAARTNQPAIYHSLDPAFVVNFQHQSQHRIRFLQTKMEAMARDQEVIEALQTHMPAIRNTLLLLLSQQDYETMRTVEGKERLREAAREEINLILEAQAAVSGVEAVFFTGFVMQ
ncbi:flagellar basal body-associated FliL family protein [Nitrosococcus oceani]|uniref:Flagellar protein FliL n=2 Tax=Nitrosococcus oceani TaxID=1229 RepID=Q3J970_NITOC|nr:flagellar basal body-associated FliL family protein [Nitrosococcus oceani]KFI18927.1 flagellar basal body protein FliL [Nitrosococcus oceani C-27]ABA58626.1 Flagellar basal body-associated protein FliL [Nitrosococcus oceani ATCC 19707]EDZ67697.1 flagellar basal body-associated protein FliL [Nitrosococcus oceani AFC27]KFI22209.1 flagellar basal body protein FliL [Nitrosococcus oceani]GEM19746.1 flagellar basal body protein FliL [Nitrosococcus oceani]